MTHILNDEWTDIIARLDYAFQPIVNIHTGAVYGYEALLRELDKARFASINAFLDRTYNANTLIAVHWHLLEKALRKISGLPWSKQIKLFYNLDSRLFSVAPSNETFSPGELIRFAAKIGTVCFEISERFEACRAGGLKQAISAFRKQGLKIAIDDFGSGFSGLQLLYYTRPDYVKIDRFYIDNIDKDPHKRMLASSIVHIAHLLGSLVIAEGVETVGEYYACRNIGCDLLQGYLIQVPQTEIDALEKMYPEVKQLHKADNRSAGRKDLSLLQAETVYIDPILHDAKVIEILDRFKRSKANTFIPVVTARHEPIGIIREEKIKEFAYSEYGRYLLVNPTFGKTIDDFISRMPVVDINTSVERILETFSINDHLEGILITDSMKYVGFLSAHSLIRILNEKKLAAARDQNPLTKMAGNALIYEYISNALPDKKAPYALIYFDFDNFKAYNDKYGFRQGDRVILLFAELLKSHARDKDRFAGHVGGDDFFLGIKNQPLQEALDEILYITAKFRNDVESFYDQAAIARGCIEARDRDGLIKCFPIITISTAVLELPDTNRQECTPEEIGIIMAKMKRLAKRTEDRIQVKRLTKKTTSTKTSPTERSAPQPVSLHSV